ncbi:MAG: extracellular solute-binding protein [Alphaproteobacteria bacterium]
MNRFTRRDSIKIGAGAVAGAALIGLPNRRAHAQSYALADPTPPDQPIEDGASLRVLRPSKFVDGDERLFLENSKKFTEATGVDVKVDISSWEDLRPQVATAANVGSGPDVVMAWSDDPHKFADKVLDLTDLATYLGEKYGGWWPLAEKYGIKDGRWIGMPLGASGGTQVYRKSFLQEAGYETPPNDLDGFLTCCQKLKEVGHPAGYALGNAVGDANGWCTWVVWAHGGKLLDDDDNVVLNSPETIEAVKYAKALYDTFIPGTLSWLDPSNNKAFLAGEIGLTQNGISIYYAAKNSDDAAVKALAEDIYHAEVPIGPVGRPTQRALVVNSMVFGYTPYPNAAKEYLRFMMEEEQYAPYLDACIGYWNHPLQTYDSHPVWTTDPKHEPYKHVFRDALWDGYSGSISEQSSVVLSEFVIVQMIASVCAGEATPEEAVAEAERRTLRYFR